MATDELGNVIDEEAGDQLPAEETNVPEQDTVVSQEDLDAALKVKPEGGEPDPNKPAADAVTVSREEFEALKKKLTHQETFIQRQGTEIGQLRKLKETLQETFDKKRQEAHEQLMVDPIKAMDAHAAANQAQQQIQNLQQQEALEINRYNILSAIPDYDTRVEDVANEALSMGVDPRFVAQYRQNPYGTPVGVLMPYIRAAETRKQMVAMQAKGPKPATTVARSIEQAAKRKPAITASAQSTSSQHRGSVDPSQIANLPYAELERLLKQS